jgi:hypothetical protein
VGPRMDDVEIRTTMPLPGLELRPLGRPACSQSLYRLRYPDSYFIICPLRYGCPHSYYMSKPSQYFIFCTMVSFVLSSSLFQNMKQRIRMRMQTGKIPFPVASVRNEIADVGDLCC